MTVNGGQDDTHASLEASGQVRARASFGDANHVFATLGSSEHGGFAIFRNRDGTFKSMMGVNESGDGFVFP